MWEEGGEPAQPMQTQAEDASSTQKGLSPGIEPATFSLYGGSAEHGTAAVLPKTK